MSEVNERREVAAEEENRMEVNCNGHTSIPESESNVEAQGTKQSTEEEEDQQNANGPESHTETKDTLSDTEEPQTCNGSPGDNHLQASLSPDSVTVELKEGEKEKEEEEMDIRGETKREDKEKDGQNG